MELCDATMTDVIIQFNHTDQNEISENCYSLASIILLQLMKAVSYLHEHKPPIIHRDIKPGNVLINRLQRNLTVKLADFGLARYYNFVDQLLTKNVGTLNFMAPEVSNQNQYDTKCDIYSIGVIIQKLFNIDFNRNIKDFNPVLNKKFESLMTLASDCLNLRTVLRPTGKDIIEKKDLWFHNTQNYEEILNKIYQNIKPVNQSTLRSHTLMQYRIDRDLYKSYESKFKDICIIGSGTFGQVWKVQERMSNKEYAIKKIKILTNNYDLLDKYLKRELEILSNLDERYVVKYVDSWIDENYFIDEDQKNFGFLMNIQTELCLFTLEDITFKLLNPNNLNENRKVSAFKNSKNLFETIYDTNTNLLNFVGYYVATEILVEILECVSYLHNCKPEIIHRNLKPSNILITYAGNKRFVKLADFVLATLHEFAEDTHTILHGLYSCPDINSGHYNTMSDIYVLHYVIQELFNTDLNSEINANSQMLNKYIALQYLIEAMGDSMIRRRPKCEEILKRKKLWGLSLEDVRADEKFNSILTPTAFNSNLIDNFVEIFISVKSGFIVY